MPFISPDNVKAKRTAINNAFPRKDGWKVSVTRPSSMEVRVAFLKGPLALTADAKGYQDVNTTHIDKVACSPEAAAVFHQTYQIINEGNGPAYESADYGTIPKFYTSIHVGAYDNAYEVIKRA